MKRLFLLTLGCCLALSAAAADVVQLRGVNYQQMHGFSSSNDWYTQVVCQDDWYVYFDVANAARLTDNHVYTTAELNLGYTYAKHARTNRSFVALDASYKQWTDGEGLFHIEGSMLAEEETTHEQLQLQISYTKSSCQVSGQVYQLEFSESDLADDTRITGLFQWIGISETAQLFILLRAHEGIVGDYSWDDVVEQGTGMNRYFSDGAPAGTVTFCDLAATITANAQGGYDCQFNLTGRDGNGYQGTISYVKPTIEATDTVRLDADNLTFGYNAASATPQVKFSASDDTYDLSLWVFADTIEGQWSSANDDFDRDFCRVRYRKDGQQLAPRIVAGEIECYQQPDSSFLLTGWIDCEDAVHYELHLVQYYTPVVKTREETVSFNDAELVMLPENNAYYVEAITDDRSHAVRVLIYSDEVAGDFVEQIDPMYTYVAYDLTEDGEYCSEIFNLIEGEVHTTVDNGRFTMRADLLMEGNFDIEDVPLFHLTMRGLLPTDLLSTEQDGRARKFIRQGQMLIAIPQGATYTAAGQRL